WLGVVEEPRVEDILGRISKLTTVLPSEKTVAAVGSILSHLNRRIADRPDEANRFTVLRSLPWLPAQGKRQRWYRPSDLYAIFSAHLFSESGALFLDVPQRVQRDNAKLLDYLNVNANPTVDLVVTHLLHCASVDKAVNRE